MPAVSMPRMDDLSFYPGLNNGKTAPVHGWNCRVRCMNLKVVAMSLRGQVSPGSPSRGSGSAPRIIPTSDMRSSFLPDDRSNPTFIYPFITYRRCMSHHEASGHHEHHDSSAPCRVCTSSVDPDNKVSQFGICHHCMYKILILVLIVMISISYVAWFGVL